MGWRFYSLSILYIASMLSAVHISYGTLPVAAEHMGLVIGSEKQLTKVETQENETEATLLFVGDILLARRVEKIIDERGIDHVFGAVADTIQSADVAIGNFEGSVPEKHVPTRDFGMRFSVKSAYLEALKDVGFDVLSLANNHSFDYGAKGHQNTRTHCRDAELVCGGTALGLNDESVRIVSVGAHRFGILFLHALSPYDESDVISYLTYLNDNSDVQIAYVHWGQEYEPHHSPAQETLAHLLVDSGADVVISHHPHVIQDIALYKDAPIFYSLGNFVFDQYFDTAVQEGLMVEMRALDTEIRYTLHGVRSVEERRPVPMEPSREAEILTQLLSSIEETGTVTSFPGGFSIKQ